MKKNILYAIMALVIFAGCSREEERLFDQSASQRAQAAMENANSVLINAENGWDMIYFANPESNRTAHITLYFKKNSQVIAEMANSAKKIALDSASVWEIVNDICPILTFNTYNNIMHTWADPQEDGLGYEGDYEFLIMEATPDIVRLKGKKYGAYSVMYPRPANMTTKDIYNQSNEMVKRLFHNNNLLQYRDGETAYSLFNVNNLLYITEAGTAYEKGATAIPFAGTYDGIQIMNTLSGKANTNRHFVFNEQTEILTSETATIECGNMGIYFKNYITLQQCAWKIDLQKTYCPAIKSYIQSINAILHDLESKARLTSANFYYTEDVVWEETIKKFYLDINFYDGESNQVLGSYEYQLSPTNEDLALTYVGPKDENSTEMLKMFPDLGKLVNDLATQYTLIPDNKINPAEGSKLQAKDNSELYLLCSGIVFKKK